ncbi:MAG TPA: hypothetical protein VL727_21705 [Puia sp.]|nr:hypothetical protein [Puia sp.]
MHILLFIIYSLLCIYGIQKIPFIRNSGIRPPYLLLFFGLHVLAGLLHNVIAYRYYPQHGDIWNFYQWSLEARHRLIYDHTLYLYTNDSWLLFTQNGIAWVYMLLDMLSSDSMTVNTLLFSFPVFLGNIALFRLLRRRFPNAILAAVTVFLLPSALFWTACIHREALLYLFLGFVLYSFDRLLTHPLARKHLLIFLFGLLLILYFRFSILLALLPALAAWLAAERRWPLRRLLMITGAALLLLVIPLFISPDFYASVAAAITARQQEFVSLEGHSRLPLPVMNGTWTSIIKTIPSAIRNGFFEPLPGSGGQIIYLAFSFELLAIWIIIAAALVLRPASSTSQRSYSLTLFCIIFSLSGLLIIGATVPFVGAIVRYRSIFLPFLLAPALYRLHSTPLISRFDDWLSLKVFSIPKPDENAHSY